VTVFYLGVDDEGVGVRTVGDPEFVAIKNVLATLDEITR